MLRIAGLASRLGGRALAQGARQIAAGQQPIAQDMLLTGKYHAFDGAVGADVRSGDEAGQLISMDAGDMLPPELMEILARPRADAEPTPPKQLERVLDRA